MGEIVVFTDVRQTLEPGSLRVLVEDFADPQVGCVSGELMLGDPDAGEKNRGMGLYWRIEKTIRELESASGSVVGATGAFYGVRRALLEPIPPETLLDDVYIPMQVVHAGKRVVFEPKARAWDLADQGTEREFARKVRTLSGNYQLLQLQPWLLSGENPIRFEFVSHKILRLVVPFALVAALVACAFLPQPVYRAALVLQIAFYALSLAGLAGVEIRTGRTRRRRCFHVRGVEHRGGGGVCEFCNGKKGSVDALKPTMNQFTLAPEPALVGAASPADTCAQRWRIERWCCFRSCISSDPRTLFPA